jgi:hypothetical protein
MFKVSFDLMENVLIGLYNMNIIFPLILFYYLNHLQFKFDFFSKIAGNKINLLNIENQKKVTQILQ